MRHLENKNEEDYKMNQQHVGMQELFRGHVIIDWEGTNLNYPKHKRLNDILARKCVEFHTTCWKHRNKEFHDKPKQRQRIKKWYKRINEVKNGDEMQLKSYVRKHKINMERCKIDTTKRWTRSVTEIEKRIEKTP